MVCQESAGNPYAIRVERGFLARYLSGLKALVLSTASDRDDYWMTFPDLFSTSYGLLQVMYPVAVELGVELRYPTELCDPGINFDAACRKLVRDKKLAPAGFNNLLLRYNGGGDAEYPIRVGAWRQDLLTAGIVPRLTEAV